MLEPILSAFFYFGIVHAQVAPATTEEESIPHPTDPRKRFVAGPHLPAISATAHGVNVYLGVVDSITKSIAANCDRAKVPLTKEQLIRIRNAGTSALKAEFKSDPHDVWLIGNCIIQESTSLGATPMSVAQVRVSGAIMARECVFRYRITRAVFESFAALATSKQRESCEYFMNQPAFRQDIVEKNREIGLRRSRGEFTEAEVKTLNIATGTSGDIRQAALPSFEAYVRSMLEWRVLTYRIRYKLDAKQEAAAESILSDCAQRALRTLESGNSRLGKLWSDVCVSLVEREKGGVSLRKTVQRFREELNIQLLPSIGEIDQRLDAILTSDQKAKARPAPPNPEWVEFAEELDAALSK